jgi:CubicO group peptidase (beta-lactamase class C family)
MIIIIFTSSLGLSQNIEGKDYNEEIIAYVNQYLQQSKIPGLSIAVTSSEEILYQGSFGVQQIGPMKPMSTNMPSPIGSLTKSFTALAILQQVEKGVLSLEDKVTRYIPWYKTFDKEKSDNITIEMLLNNSSGLPHTLNSDDFFQNNPSMDFEKAIKAHENVTLYFDPGTSYGYSNEGFIIAGYILELVTGTSYVDYVRENVFEPLEMSQTTTDIEELLETKFIYGHLANVDGFLPANKIYSGIMIPAGSELISTTSDLSNYAQMLMNKGAFHGKQLLSQELFTKYLSDGINPFKMYNSDLSYQNGWMYIKDSPIMMHMGQTLSASSILLIDQENNIAISILCNVSDVVNGEESIYNLALYLLQLFTNKDYSINLQPNLPILQEDTPFIQKDKNIIGQYKTSSGLTKAIISETESGSYEAIFQNALGVSSYDLSFITSQDVYAKNVGSEIIINLIRSTSNDIIGFTHPNVGSFERVNTNRLTGYHTIQNNFMSSILPDDYTFTNDTLSNGLIELRMEETHLLTEELPSYIDEIFDNLKLEKPYGNIIESSTLREFTLNGLSCYEKIQIIEYKGNIYAFVFYNIMDIKRRSSITIYGSLPFEYLTQMRSDVIQVFIKN